MGRVIGWADHRFNQGKDRKLKGLATITLLTLAAWATGAAVAALPGGPIPETLVAAILLAQRSLVDHVRAVADGLRLSLPAGRQAVALIVSRDTADNGRTRHRPLCHRKCCREPCRTASSRLRSGSCFSACQGCWSTSW